MLTFVTITDDFSFHDELYHGIVYQRFLNVIRVNVRYTNGLIVLTKKPAIVYLYGSRTTVIVVGNIKEIVFEQETDISHFEYFIPSKFFNNLTFWDKQLKNVINIIHIPRIFFSPK